MKIAFRLSGICALLLTICICVSATAFAGLPPFEPNGGFHVEQLTRNGWENAGFLSCDAFFRERSLNLPAGDGPVTIRLIKSGDGPGHIDAAHLNGQPPVHVRGVDDDLPGHKLAGKDFDVIHSPDAPECIEMTFPVSGRLMLAARVEGKRPHEAPFRFPKDSANGAFIRFAPSAEEICLFYTQTLPGTGHPAAVTGAWARMEDKMLRVRVDFCPDNTLDGGKDYAAVHIRTPDGVKEFRMSRDQTRYGQPDFTYTPEVPWQHKVYTFCIPAAELEGLNLSSNMELAVTAYGTAGPGPYAPSMVYGDQNREYMAAYHHYYADNHTQIRLQRFSPSGGAVGSPVDVTVKDAANKFNAVLSFNKNQNQFLVLWEEDQGGIVQIARQLVSDTGAHVGEKLFTGALEQLHPAAAFSQTSSRYLAVWVQGGDVYGEQLFPNASSVDPGPFPIAIGDSSQTSPDVVWDAVNNRFIVVWEDDKNAATTGTDIYSIIIDPADPLSGRAGSVTTHTDGQTQPRIAYEPGSDRSLVVWIDYRNNGTEINRDVFGQFLDGQMHEGGELTITDAPEDLSMVRVFPAGKSRFLVIWSTANTGANNRIQGRFVTTSGAMTPIRSFTDASVAASLGDLSGTGGPGMLMVYSIYTASGIDINASPIPMGSVTPILPLLLFP